ncbi:MAG TPA: hypothetical protein VGM51_19090 [Armatimonadota bacterium]|jgi:hypothetical protein
MNRRCFAFILAITVATASSARADAGTPLMWVGFGQLVILNWLIALIEALVIWRVFRVRYLQCACWLIAANYASFFAGIGLLSVVSSAGKHASGESILRHGLMLLLVAIGISFLATIVLEWPFCRVLARGTAHPWRKAFRMSLLAQTVSYALLVPLYISASPITFLTKARLSPAITFASLPVATAYYVGKGDAVWQVNLDGTGLRYAGIGAVKADEDIWIRPGKDGIGDLCAMSGGSAYPFIHAARSLSERIAPVGTYAKRTSRSVKRGQPLTFEDWEFVYPADLRAPGDTDWYIETDVFAGRGITVNKKGEEYNLALETPYLAWTPRFATLLPGDMAVFQLGPNIMLLHMPTKRIAILAEGRSPVVVLKQPVR